MRKGNKVKFNLKNVHIAPIDKETGMYLRVIKVPGAVNLSMEPQGDIGLFYADGVVYYQSAANNGYRGTLELAILPDEVREAIFNEVPNEDNVAIENAYKEYNDFALGFQVDGDMMNTLFWYYVCSASRPTQDAATNEESKTPQTETINISCTCNDIGDVRAKTTAKTSDEVRRNWFNAVYVRGANAGTGAERMKVWPISRDPLDEKYGSMSSADLLGNDVSIVWSGTRGKVYGTIHNIKEPWTGYSAKGENTGHFFPMLVDSQYDGEEISYEGAKEPKVSTELKAIVRIENLVSKILTVKVKEKEAFSLDFSEADLEV